MLSRSLQLDRALELFFLEGLAVLPLSRRPFFDNVVVALVGEFLDPTFHFVAGSIVRVLNVCKDWREVLGRLQAPFVVLLSSSRYFA